MSLFHWPDGVTAPVLLLVLILAFIGWGSVATRLAGIAHDPTTSFFCCLSVLIGKGLFTWLLGWMVYFQQFTPMRATLLMIFGAALSIPILRAYMRQTNATSSPRFVDWTPILFTIATLLFWLYLPPLFNLNDDSTAYGVFPTKIRDLGGIGPEPFSERRLFSLGAQYPIQALILFFLPMRYLSLFEPTLGIALTILFLAIVCRGTMAWRSRIVCGTLLLSIVGAFGSKILANLAPTFMIVPSFFVLIFAVTGTRREEDSSRVGYAGAIGVVAAYAICLRPTAAPFGIFLLMLTLLHQAKPPREFLKTLFLKRGAAAILGAVLFALPFSIDLFRSSGTFLFPVLGRGFHSSATGRLPSIASTIPIAVHLQNLVKIPVTDVLLILAAVAVFASTYSTRSEKDKTKRLLQVFAVMVFSYALIVYQTGGVSVQRYAAPAHLAFLVYVIATLDLSAYTHRVRFRLHRPLRRLLVVSTGAGALLVIPLAFYKASPYLSGWARSKLEVRERTLFPSQSEIQAYRDLQQAIPEGATILSSLMRNYLLDFRRNHIIINDQPGMAGPPPGWPTAEDGNDLAEYLRRNDIQYVAVNRLHSEGGGLDQRNPNRIKSDAPLQGWSSITGRAGALFESNVQRPPFLNSLVFENDRIQVYQVPK